VLPEPGVAIGPCDRTIWVTSARGLFETANLVVRRELFERLGGFESWLVPSEGIELGEDVWFGWRARRAGARVGFAGDALVHHAVFRGGWRDVVRVRRRLRYFPALARRIPELREELLWRRVFLTRRSAAFDAAVAGVVGAALVRRAAPLALVAPYAVELARGGRRAAVPGVVGDAVGAASLVAGSVRYRSPVL
jgi:GT2 family glycosyltransferase